VEQWKWSRERVSTAAADDLRLEKWNLLISEIYEFGKYMIEEENEILAEAHITKSSV